MNPNLQVAVVRIERPGSVSADLSAQLDFDLRRALEDSGLSVLSAEELTRRLGGRDPAQCETNRACYSLLGQALGVSYVVRYEGGAVESDVVLVAQAISSHDGTVAAENSLQTTTARIAQGLVDDLKPFAQKVQLAAKSADPFAAAPKIVEAPRSDVPTRTDLTPKGDGASNGVTAAIAPAHSRTPAYVAAGGAVVAAGTAAVLAALGASASSCLNGPSVSGHPTVCVPQSEAPGKLQQQNASYTGAAVSGGIAVALAAATVWLWDH